MYEFRLMIFYDSNLPACDFCISKVLGTGL